MKSLGLGRAALAPAVRRRGGATAAAVGGVWDAPLDRQHGPVREHLHQTQAAHQVDELVDLVRGAGDLEDEALDGGVDDLGAEDVGKPQGFHPFGAGRAP